MKQILKIQALIIFLLLSALSFSSAKNTSSKLTNDYSTYSYTSINSEKEISNRTHHLSAENLFLDADCDGPSNLQYSFINESLKIAFEWDEPAVLPAEGYEWEVRTSGVPFSGEEGLVDFSDILAGVHQDTASNLRRNETYFIYIRSNCGLEDYSAYDSDIFTTPSDWPVILPYTESFISSSTPQLWTNTGSESWLFNTGAAYGAANADDHTEGGGTRYAWIDGSNGVLSNALITPEFYIENAEIPIVDFYFFSNNTNSPGDNNTLMVSAYNGTNWLPVFIYTDDDPEWLLNSYEIDKDDFPTTIQFKFTILGTANTTYYNDILIDDFSIYDLASACLPPQTLVLDNITATEVTITWDDVAVNSPVDAFEWELRVSGAPFSGETGRLYWGSVTGAQFSETIPGLDEASIYSIYLRSNCGDGNYSAPLEATFSTTCASSSTDIDQNFDINIDDLVPPCWTNQHLNGDNDIKAISSAINPSASAYGGSGKMAVWYSSIIDDGEESILISPPLNTQGRSSLYYSYRWYKSSGAPLAQFEGMQVQYSLDQNTWVSIGDFVSRYGPTEGWEVNYFGLPAEALNQETVYIGFRFISEQGQNCYLDEFAETNCIAPTSLTVNYDDDYYKIILSWAEPILLPSNGYEWELREFGTPFSGDNLGLFSSGSVANEFVSDTVYDLVSLTDYFFYIRSNCGEELYSFTSSLEFTTPAWPIDIPYLQTFPSSSEPELWTNTGSVSWQFSTGAGYGAGSAGDHTIGGGTRYAWIDGSSGVSQNELISPEFIITNAEYPVLDFYYFSNNTNNPGDNNTLSVEAYDGTSWNTIFTYAGDHPNWKLLYFVIDKDIYPTTIQFKFIVTGTANWKFYNDILIDDFNIYDLATLCLPPQDVNVEHIKTHEIAFSWNDVLLNSPVEYFVWELRTEGEPFSDEPGLIKSDSVTGDVFNLVIPELNSATNYNFHIRSRCSEGNYSAVITNGPNQTLCSFINLPSLYDFNENPAIPICWSEENVLGNMSLSLTSDAYEGDNSIHLAGSSPVSPRRTRLISTPIEPSILERLSTSFYFYHFDVGFGDFVQIEDSLQVQYRVNSDGEWVNVGQAYRPHLNPIQGDYWSKKHVTFPQEALDADTLYIGYIFTSQDYYDVILDYLSIDADTFTPTPENLTLNSLEPNSVSIDWDLLADMPGARYVCQLRTKFGPENPSMDAYIIHNDTLNPGINSHVFYDLDQNTEYQIYLRALDQDGVAGVWTEPLYFLTPCFISSFPNDEQFTSDERPICWTENYVKLYNGNERELNFISSLGYNPQLDNDYDGSGFMVEFDNVAYNSNPSSTRLVSKPFETNSIDHLGLQFQWFYNNWSNNGIPNVTSNDFMQVQYSLNNEEWIDIGKPLRRQADSNYWALKSFKLPDAALNKDTLYYGFLFESDVISSSYSSILDDIKFTDCYPPGSFTQVSNGLHEISVEWLTVSNSATYEIELRTHGLPGTPGDGLVEAVPLPAGSYTYTFDELDQDAQYMAFLRTECEPGVFSDWSSALFVETLCVIYSLPYQENFDVASPQGLPYCWDSQYTYIYQFTASSMMPLDLFLMGNGTDPTIPFAYGGDGRMVLAQTHENGGGDKTRLVSPAISTVGNDDIQLSFQWYESSMDPSDEDGVWLQYSLDGEDWTNVSQFIPRYNNGNEGWVNKLFSMPEETFGKEVIYIGFEFLADLGGNCYVDELEMYGFSTNCLSPDTVYVDEYADDYAVFSWLKSSSNPPGGYIYELRSDGNPGSGIIGLLERDTIFNPNDTTLSLYNLDNETNYTLYVQSYCDDVNKSNWASSETFLSFCGYYHSDTMVHFNTSSIDEFPDCWVEQYEQGANTFQLIQSGDFPNVSSDYGGNGRMVFWNSNIYPQGSQTRFVSPNVSTTFCDSIEISYQWYQSSLGGADLYQGEGVQLQYSFDSIEWFDLGEFVKRYNENEGWSQKRVKLPDYVMNKHFVYFGYLFTSEFGFNCYLDNMEIREIQCNPPSNLTVSDISGSSATISWQKASPDAAGGYICQVRQYGNPDSGSIGLFDSDTITDGTDHFIVSTLQPDENYKVYVKSFCSEESNSVWIGPENFNACQALNIPAIENFNSQSALQFPNCWEQQYIVGNKSIFFNSDGAYPPLSQDYDTIGRMVFWNSREILEGYQTRLITAPYTTEGHSGLELSFQWYHSAVGGSEEFQTEGVQLHYSLNGTDWIDIGDFVKRYNHTSGWDKKTFYLPVEVEDQARVYFGLTFTSNQGYNCYLDHFEIKPAACYMPHDLLVLETTDTSAKIGWSEPTNPPTDGYYFQLRTQGFPGSNPNGLFMEGNVAAGATSVNLSPLEQGSIYYLYLSSICGSDTTDWTDDIAINQLACGNADAITYERFNEFQNNTYLLPNCWSQQYESGNSDIQIVVDGEDPYLPYDFGDLGGMIMWNAHEYPNGEETRLITKPLNTEGYSDMELNFYWYHTTIGDNLVFLTEGMTIQYSYDGAVWEDIDTILRYSPIEGWSLKQIFLPAAFVNQTEVYLGFKFTSNNGYNCYLDDVVIKPKSTCEPPTDINILSNVYSVEVDWSAPAVGEYIEYEVRTEGLPGSGSIGLIKTDTLLLNAFPTLIEDLPIDTEMQIYMRSYCSYYDMSAWTEPHPFFTFCSLENLPILEDFNAQGPSGCWDVIGDFEYFQNANPNYAFAADNGNDGKLITTAYNTLGISEVEILFYWEYDPYSSIYGADSMYILYSTDRINWMSSDYSYSTMSEFPVTLRVTESMILPPDAGNQHSLFIQFYFVDTDPTDFRNIYIQDIQIRELECAPPQDLDVTILDENSVALSWSPSVSNPSNGYIWEVDEHIGSDFFTSAVGAGAPTGDTLNNLLTQGDDYTFTVRSVCGDIESIDKEPFYFVFEPSDIPPYDLPLVEEFRNSIPFSWSISSPEVQTSSNTGVGDSKVLQVSASGANHGNWSDGQWITTPAFNTLGAESVELDFYFYHRMDSYDDPYSGVTVLYSLDSLIWQNVSDLIPIYNKKSGYKHYYYNLPQEALDHESVQIRFLFSRTTYNELIYMMDYITIDRTYCAIPLDFNISNIKTDSVTLNWGIPEDNMPSSYNYEIRSSGYPGSGSSGMISSGVVDGIESTIEIELPGNNSYTAYISSTCDGLGSSGWAQTDFSMKYNLPLFEDFNTSDIFIYPAGWYNQYISEIEMFSLSSNVTLDGVGRALRWDHVDNANTRLVSPGMSTEAYSNISLQVYVYHTTNSSLKNDKIELQYSYDGQAWTSADIYISRYAETEGWMYHNITLPGGFCNQENVHLGMLFDDLENIWVDNLTISEPPSCLLPQYASVAEAFENRAEITYPTPSGTLPLYYLYEVRTSGLPGSGPSGRVILDSINSIYNQFTVAPLSPNTDYVFYMRPICSESDSTIWTPPLNFTTLCASQLPYTESFGSTFYTCWEDVGYDGGDIGSDYIDVETHGGNPSASPYGGSGNMLVYSPYHNENDSSRASTVKFSMEGMEQVSMDFQWYHSSGNSANDRLQVQYSLDGETWIDVGDEIPRYLDDITNGWTQKTINFPDEINGMPSVYIGFLFIHDFGWDCYLDEVNIQASDICMPPLLVYADTVYSDGAHFVWEPPSATVNGSYHWEVRTSGLPGSGTGLGYINSGVVPPSDTSVYVGGLDPNNSYFFYVSAECTIGNLGDWSEAYTIYTCDAYPLPLYEGFNVTNFTANPDCWHQEYLNGNNAILYYTTVNNPSVVTDYEPGVGRMIYWNSNIIPSGESTRLISPAVSTVGETDLEVHFQWYHSANAPEDDNIQYEGVYVQYSLDKISWTSLGDFIPRYNEVEGWFQKTRFLPPGLMDEPSVYIALKFESYQGFNCYVDALSINTTQCYSPSQALAINISDTSAVLSWTPPIVEPMAGYIYEIRTEGSPEMGATGFVLKDSVSAGITSAQLLNLDPGTDYFAFIRSKCGIGNYSAWTMQHAFRTNDCASQYLPFNEGFDETNSIPVCWTQQHIHFSEDIEVSTSGGDMGTSNYLRFESDIGDNGTSTRLISPPINTVGVFETELQFSWFLYYNISNAGEVHLEYSFNKINWTEFAVLDNETTDDALDDEWDQFGFVMPVATSNQELVYVGLRFESSLGNICRLDQFVVKQLIDCNPPLESSAFLTTNFSSRFSWDPAQVFPATNGYNYEIRSFGEPETGASGLIKSGTTSLLLPDPEIEVFGLPADSTLYFYLQSNCGTSYSNWSDSIQFSTCGLSNIRYYSNFDDDQAFPYGTRYEQVVQSDEYYFYTDDPGFGETGHYLRYYNDETHTDLSLRYVLPAFSTLDEYNIEMMFQLDQVDGTPDFNGIQTQYSFDGTNWNDFGDFIPKNGDFTGWNLIQVNFPEILENKEVLYISLVFNARPQTYTGIDEILIRTLNNCIPPTEAHVEVIDNSTAEMVWERPDFATDYYFEWEVRTTGEPGSGSIGLFDSDIESLNDTLVSLTGLETNQNYVLYLRSYCNDLLTDYSSWSLPEVFSTACLNQSLPIFENFYAPDTISMPACWTQQYINGSNSLNFFELQTEPNIDFDYDSTGRMLTWLSADIPAGNQTRFVSPQFNTVGTTSPALEFMWYHSDNGGANFNLTEGVQLQFSFDSIDWYNTGDFVRRFAPITGWEFKEMILPDSLSERNELYIGLLFTSNHGFNCYLDNLVIREKSLCQPPSDITASPINLNSVELSWNSPDLAPVNGYIYEIRLSGDPDSGNEGLFLRDTIAPGITSTNVTGLQRNLNYYAYVASYCDAGILSEWSDIVGFVVGCDTYDVPLHMNFDSATTYIDPACWQQEKIKGNPMLYYTESGSNPTLNSAFGGNGKMAYFDSYNAQFGDSLRLISPVINTTGMSDLEVRFQWFHSILFPSATEEGVQMQYSLDGINWINFASLIQRYNIVNSWDLKTIPLPDEAEDQLQVQIAFLFISNQSANCYLDNIEIRLSPTCDKPTLLSANTLDDFSAELTWDIPNPEPALGYTLEVRTKNEFGSGNDGLFYSENLSSGTDSLILDSFVPYQNYRFSLNSKCSDDNQSDWALPFLFNTTCKADYLPISEDFNNTPGGSFPACWNEEILSGSVNIQFVSASNDPLIMTDYDGDGNMVLWESHNIPASSQARLISRSFSTVGLSGVGVEFVWYHSDDGQTSSGVEGVVVEYSLNGTSWTQAGDFIDRYNPDERWNLKQVLLPDQVLDKDSIMIAFKFLSNNDFNCYLDNVEIREMVTVCEPPESVFVIDISTSSATLVWSPPYYTPEDGYEYEVRVSGLPGSGTTGLVRNGFTDSDDLSDQLIGLQNLTTYYCYVRSLCDQDLGLTSFWSQEYSFTTECSEYFVDYFEGFNVGRDEWLPNCWSVDGDPDDVELIEKLRNYTPQDGLLDTTYAYGNGGKMIKIYADGENYRIISPKISTEGVFAADVNFMLYMNAIGEDYPGSNLCPESSHLQLQYSYDQMDWVDFGPAHRNKDAFVEAWVSRSTPLPQEAIDQPIIYLAFSFSGINSFTYLFDSLSVNVPPACGVPKNIYIDADPNNAYITWDAPDNPGVSYDYELRTMGTVELDTTGLIAYGNTTNTYLDLSSLIPDTIYTFYVRSKCTDGSEGYWSYPVTFKTPLRIEAVPYYQSFSSGFSLEMPEGWSIKGSCNKIGPYARSSSNWGSEGKGVYFEKEGSMLISPPFSPGANTGLQIEFQLYQYDYNYLNVRQEDAIDVLVDVLISTDKQNWVSFAEPISCFGDFENWVEHILIVPPEALNAEVLYIAFRNSNLVTDEETEYAETRFDEFRMNPICDCEPPENLSAIATNPSTVELFWENPPNPPTEGYTVEVRASGNGNFGSDGLIYQGQLPLGQTSLSVNNTNGYGYYFYYIRSNCAANDTSHWASGRYYQLCNTPQNQVIEDFNTVNDISPCWSFSGPMEILGGEIRFYYNCGGYCSSDFYLGNAYSPAIKTLNNSQAELYFDWEVDDYLSKPEDSVIYGVQVQYSLDRFEWTDAGPFIKRYKEDTNEEFEQYHIVFPAETQNQEAVFMRFKLTGMGYVRYSIDNFIFQSIPQCTMPEDVAVNIVSNESAWAVWNRPDAIPSGDYHFEVREFGTPLSGESGLVQNGFVPFQDTAVLITDLLPNTAYQFYTRANCGPEQGYTEWTDAVSFFTDCVPYQPYYSEDFNAGYPNVEVDLPLCYSQEAIIGDYHFQLDDGGYIEKGIKFNNGSQTISESRLITPFVEIPEDNTTLLDFWWLESDFSAINSFNGVQCEYRLNEGDAWTNLGDFIKLSGSADAWVLHSITLPAELFEGTLVQFAFYFKSNNSYTMKMDNLAMRTPPEPLAGTYYIPTDYPTLESIINDMDARGIGDGGVVFEVEPGNPQTAPPGGYLVSTLGSKNKPIILNGNGNVITASNENPEGSLVDAIFTVLAADYVTINDFEMYENPLNNNLDWATNNMTEFGIAQFAIFDPIEDESDHLTITNCLIQLKRQYANSFGIYSTNRHSRSDIYTITSPSKENAHDSLVIQGCDISLVNNGIYVNNRYNTGVIIGANSSLIDLGYQPELGNTISAYGSYASIANYAGFTNGKCNGIYFYTYYSDDVISGNYHIESNTVLSGIGAASDGDMLVV